MIYFEIISGIGLGALLNLLVALGAITLTTSVLFVTTKLQESKYFKCFKLLSIGMVIITMSQILDFINDITNRSEIELVHLIAAAVGLILLLVGFRKGYKLAREEGSTENA